MDHHIEYAKEQIEKIVTSLIELKSFYRPVHAHLEFYETDIQNQEYFISEAVIALGRAMENLRSALDVKRKL